MPPVITAIIGGLVAIFGTAGALVAINVITYGLLYAGLNFAMSGISKLLTKKPNLSSLTHDSLSRTVTVRQPISPRKIIYGSVRVGGVITFIHVEGTSNQYLHLVITLAGHQVNAINTMYFDGVAVPVSAGSATGNYAGFVTVEYNLGTTTQAAFPNLVANSNGKWTSAHQQKGRAGVHVRLKWDANKFPNGVPNISFDVDGALVYDPRSNARAFSKNAALCLADYLTNTDYGLGAATQKATRIQSSGGSSTQKWTRSQTVTSGDDIEIMVYVENIGAKPVVVGTNGQQSTVTVQPGTKQNVFLRDKVSGTTAQLRFDAQIAADALDFLAFTPIIRHNGIDENLIPAANRDFSTWTLGTSATVTLTQNQIASVEIDRAATVAAANICDESVSLAAGGTESRYTTNGVIDTSVIPADAISSLLTAMAGFVTYSNAMFKIYAGAYASPVSPDGDVSEGDLRGDITIQATRSKRDLFNGVKGLFVSPVHDWQPTDFPPKQNTTYLARDRGETIWKDVELPFTTSVATAQRLAKIELERNARQISVTLPLKLTKYTIAPLDTIRVTNTRLGWVNKTFEVVSCNLVFDDTGQQGYIIGVDVNARETDSTVFSWTAGSDELASAAQQFITAPDNSRLEQQDPSLLPIAYGKNLVPNPSFESNTSGVVTVTGLALGDKVCDGWIFDQNDGGFFSPSLETNATRVRSGAQSVAIGLQSGAVLAASTAYAGFVRSTAKLPIPIGDIVRCSGWYTLDAGGAAGAGISVSVFIQLDIYDGSGTRLGGLAGASTNATTGTMTFLQGAVTVPATLGGGIPAYGRFAVILLVNNSNGSPATLANTFSAHFDDARCVFQNTAFDLTPINTSGHATVAGGALSQSGSTGTINVASRTIQYGDGSITYSAGSVTVGVSGTYYVYADDPTYSGGAVTYVASATESDVYAANGRIFFGRIVLTIGGGGGATSPNPPGTGGGRVPL